MFFLLTALIRCMREAEKGKSKCEKSKVVSVVVVLMGLTGGSGCSYKRKTFFASTVKKLLISSNEERKGITIIFFRIYISKKKLTFNWCYFS